MGFQAPCEFFIVFVHAIVSAQGQDGKGRKKKASLTSHIVDTIFILPSMATRAD